MADAGTLAAFSDFMAATRQLPLSSPDKISNQMTANRTYLTRLILDGVGAEEMFQDGNEIIEQLQLAYTSNFRHYKPTDPQTPSGDSSLVTVKVPWRFSLVDSSWYDHEIILNGGGDQKTCFKRLAKAKRQKMFTDFFDGVEASLWATPNAAEMEGGNSAGKTPYSLRVFINTAGTVPNATAVASDGDGAADTWSTIMQASPSTYSNWANQVSTYDASTSTTIQSTLEDALDDMWLKVNFTSPDKRTGMMDTKSNKCRIITNKEGYKHLIKLARTARTGAVSKEASNLGWANGVVTYHGLPIDYISSLDSTSLCASGKPRFYFINFNHIKLMFHKTRYLYPKTFEGTANQPMANVEYRDTWWNLLCTNRREQGLVKAA
jgi:hypothetical protein